MSIHLKTINKERVHKVKLPSIDASKIKGYDILPNPDSNIFICAKKKSGKSTTIFKIMKACTDKKTKIYIFCSTINKDRMWIYVVKYFKKKGYNINTYTSIMEGKTNNLEEVLEENRYDDDAQSSESEEDEVKQSFRIFDMQDLKEREYKPKKIAVRMCMIFDDLGGELKNPAYVKLLKTNRHFGMTITSSQYMNDILPESRKQIDVLLLFKGHSNDKLEIIHKDTDLCLPLDQFIDLYKTITGQNYTFLYIDTRNESYRKNFDKQISIIE